MLNAECSLTDTIQIISFPPNNRYCLWFGASDSAVNQLSQHLTILTISWLMVGPYSPFPPSDYYLQTQALHQWLKPAPLPQAESVNK